MDITLDSEFSIPGSIPGEALLCITMRSIATAHIGCLV